MNWCAKCNAKMPMEPSCNVKLLCLQCRYEKLALRVTDLEKDKARLDWLLTASRLDLEWLADKSNTERINAIDAAMTKEGQ